MKRGIYTIAAVLVMIIILSIFFYINPGDLITGFAIIDECAFPKDNPAVFVRVSPSGNLEFFEYGQNTFAGEPNTRTITIVEDLGNNNYMVKYEDGQQFDISLPSQLPKICYRSGRSARDTTTINPPLDCRVKERVSCQDFMNRFGNCPENRGGCKKICNSQGENCKCSEPPDSPFYGLPASGDPSTCYNNNRDNGEAGIDCGGPCSRRCQDGQDNNQDSDGGSTGGVSI